MLLDVLLQGSQFQKNISFVQAAGPIGHSRLAKMLGHSVSRDRSRGLLFRGLPRYHCISNQKNMYFHFLMWLLRYDYYHELDHQLSQVVIIFFSIKC